MQKKWSINYDYIDDADNNIITVPVHSGSGEIIHFDVSSGYIVEVNVSGSDLEIPSEIEGSKVNAIGERAFKTCSSLNIITVPSSINYINESAFEGCNSKLVFRVSKDTYAAKWAKDHGYSVVYLSENSSVLGDINGDGGITTKDAVLALQMSTGKREQSTIADVNKDGSVTTKDAVLILRYSTGKIKSI